MRQKSSWAPEFSYRFTRLVVAAAIVEALERLDLEYPMIDSRKEKELIAVRAALLGKKQELASCRSNSSLHEVRTAPINNILR